MRGSWRRGFKAATKRWGEKPSKYRNVKTVFDDVRFDSKGECDCYKYLQKLALAGQLDIIELQPKVYLTEAKILYKPDFLIFFHKTRELIWIDYKGVSTAVFQLKKRLWKTYGPGSLWLMTGYGDAIKQSSVISSLKGNAYVQNIS